MVSAGRERARSRWPGTDAVVGERGRSLDGTVDSEQGSEERVRERGSSSSGREGRERFVSNL
jgi:hypothetical protein